MLRNRKIIIGTRGSRLSLAQTEHLRDELLLAYPGVTADQLIIKIIKTSGDKFKTENLGMMGGKGLFVKELEECLLEKSIDVAVHSLKDVPTFSSNKLSLACFLKRTDDFEKDVIIPSAGQGIITVQCREEDSVVKDILKTINDKETQILAEAERSLLEVLNGACDTPVGANAIINDEGELFLQAELLSLDGKQCFRAHKTGILEKAKSIGMDVAEEILSKAGDNFIISETKLAHTIYKKSE